MENYKLKILRTDNPVYSYDTAIEALNAYEHHYKGQPVALLYIDDKRDRHLLLAVGKRDSENELIDGRNHGPEFYEIINDLSERTFTYHSAFIDIDPPLIPFGGITEGMHLSDLMNRTDGDMSKILDILFFGDAVILPDIDEPSVKEFSFSHIKDITSKEVPIDVTDDRLIILASRGKVIEKFEEDPTIFPYAGEVDDCYVEVSDISENVLGRYIMDHWDEDDDDPSLVRIYLQSDQTTDQAIIDAVDRNTFLYKLHVTFKDGDRAPYDSEGNLLPKYSGEDRYYEDFITYHSQIAWLESKEDNDPDDLYPDWIPDVDRDRLHPYRTYEDYKNTNPIPYEDWFDSDDSSDDI